jgi:F-box/TPR repeat protein Pof3
MDLPPSLEYIRLDRCLTQPDPWHPLKLPNLHSIVLEDSPWVAEFTLGTLLDASRGALRYLHIGSFYESDILIELVLKALIDTTASKELRELSLAYVDGFADPHVSTILNNMPKLRVLRIPYSDVTDCAIKAIAEARLASLKNLGSFQQRMPNIEQVDIRGCKNLSSDAVDYGRTQGIEIIE